MDIADAATDALLDDGATADAQPTDAAADADASVDKSATCVATFGSAIGNVGFARFDGTVVAVLEPGNKTCAAPNSTHVVIEIQTGGAVYRMVVDVDDKSSPGTIRATTVAHAWVGDPWADGWHTMPLDYPTTLGVHSPAFSSESTKVAVTAIESALEIGAKISVFATAMGEVNSAHLVHRNLTNADGAIVVDVDSAQPTWLLFAFSGATF